MSGWIIPVKETKYPLNSNTFYITTESVNRSTIVPTQIDKNAR